MSKRPHSEVFDSESHNVEIKKHKSEDNLDCLLATAWKSSEIPATLPPLPSIKDAELEQQVFRHPGAKGHRKSYESLEVEGDAWIELLSTLFINRTFSETLSVGRRVQVRESLVKNVTLAAYCREYGLHSRIDIPEDVFDYGPGRGGKSKDKDIIKVQGDVFEAYVAAIINSDSIHGLTNCKNWLKALWSRTIKDEIIKAERATSTTSVANKEFSNASGRELLPKEKLSRMIVVKGIVLEYKDMPGKKKDRDNKLPLFTVGVYLTGWGEKDKLLGWGTAQSKKEAGHIAAERAIGDKKLMNVYISKKAAFMEAQQAARVESGAEEISK